MVKDDDDDDDDEGMRMRSEREREKDARVARLGTTWLAALEIGGKLN